MTSTCTGDSDPDTIEHAGMATLTPPQEQLLFLRFNFARCKVYDLLQAGQGRKPTPDEVRPLLAWFKIASAARARIVQANKERVRQIQNRALGKLRQKLEEGILAV